MLICSMKEAHPRKKIVKLKKYRIKEQRRNNHRKSKARNKNKKRIKNQNNLKRTHTLKYSITMRCQDSIQQRRNLHSLNRNLKTPTKNRMIRNMIKMIVAVLEMIMQ